MRNTHSRTHAHALSFLQLTTENVFGKKQQDTFAGLPVKDLQKAVKQGGVGVRACCLAAGAIADLGGVSQPSVTSQTVYFSNPDEVLARLFTVRGQAGDTLCLWEMLTE